MRRPHPIGKPMFHTAGTAESFTATAQHSALSTQHFRRRGYALIVVMAVLVIAAAGMVGLSRASMGAAVRANAKQRDLQREWGARSLRRAVLTRAENLLVEQERQTQRPVVRMDMQVRLGRQRFELILRDEQAKANLNALLETSAPRDVEARLVQQMSGSGLMGAVRLRPNLTPPPPRVLGPPAPGGQAGVPEVVSQRVTGYGQVFEGIDAERLGAGAAELLTCWGTGHLNVMRAPEPAMRLMLGSKLTGAEISRLISLRDQLHRGNRQGLITTGAEARQPVRRLLASAGIENRLGMPPMLETSVCHSVWVKVEDGKRQWHELEVLDRSDPMAPRRWLVMW